MKLLTILIAAYNVEKYLKETLDSLMSPKIMDYLEVLVVDDGSIDNTEAIGAEYQKKYPEVVRYIKKKNGGHGSTINKGMELATGKYFRVIDGDDYVDKTAFIKYINDLKTCSEDIVLSDLRVVNSQGDIKVDPAILENGRNPFESLVPKQRYTFSEPINTRIFGLSSLAIRTEILKKNNVHITEKCFYVDVEYIIWCIYLAKSFIYLDYPVYMYRKDDNGNNSVSKINMIKNIAMQERVSLIMCSFAEKNMHNFDNEIKREAITNRIGISLGATYRTYMLMSYSDAKNNIVRIDKEISNKFPEMYAELDKSKFFKILRTWDYCLLSVIRIAYRLYVGRI